MLRYQIIEEARSYIGKKGWTMPSNWCARFVHDIFMFANAVKYFYNGKRCDSCTTLMKWYKSKYPSWCDTDISKCRPGDLVFFQFDNDKNADHIGIFDTMVSAKKFYSVEGNTRLTPLGDQADGGYCARRSRDIKKVMLFVHIHFDDDNGNPFPVPLETLKKGCKGETVKWLQYILVTLGYNIEIDGSFGKMTESAVLNYQHMNGLTVDGKVGKNTRKSLEGE